MPIGHIFSSRIDPGDGGFLSALQLERGFERVFHNEIQTEREDVYNVKIYSSISDTPLSLSLSTEARPLQRSFSSLVCKGGRKAPFSLRV